MLLRIDSEETGSATLLRVHGRLSFEGVDDLQRACEKSKGHIELDLAQLLNVDEVGAAYLQGLVHAGVKVRRGNPYIDSLLRLTGPRNSR